MATKYLLFPTQQDAMVMNEMFWSRILGARDRSAGDTLTAYLCAAMTDPNTDETMLIVDDESYATVYPKLTAAEQQNMDANLVDETDPRVIAIKESQPKPPIPGTG